MKKLLIYVLFLFIFIGQINICKADNKEAGKFVEDVFDKTMTISRNKSTSDSQKRKELKKVIDKSVDTNWIAKFVIGKYWRRISKEEQQRFIRLYQNFLLKNYVPKFQNYSEGDIRVKKIVQQKTNVFFVQSEFDDNGGKIVNVDFRVVEKKNKLLITDVIAEGVSFIVTQRSEVNSSISNKGFDGFMEHLEELQR